MADGKWSEDEAWEAFNNGEMAPSSGQIERQED